MDTAKETVEKSRKDGMKFSAEKKFYEAWEEDSRLVKAEKAKTLYKRANLGERFKRRTFENFDASKDEIAYQRCLEYSDNYKDREDNSLLIVGSYGTGKTHLAAAIANKLMSEGVPVLFNTFSGHLNELKCEFNGGKGDYKRQMESVDMLILDDVGKEKQSEWTQSIMFDVINHRYEHMLPIVITTNLQNAELKGYLGDAVWSRLCEMCIGVKTVGEDYRKKRR